MENIILENHSLLALVVGGTTWAKIKDEVFLGKCAFCGKKGLKLQIEHLIMFNREQYGLHHPGNIAPVCVSCNKRRKDNDKKRYMLWEEQLEHICRENNDLKSFFARKKKILSHMMEGEFKYPLLSETEKHAIRVIANSLYNNVKTESDKALELYAELDKAFIKNNPN